MIDLETSKTTKLPTSSEFRRIFFGGECFFFFPFSFPGVYKRLEFKLDMVPFPIFKNTLRGSKAISLIGKSNDEVIFVDGLFTGTFSKDWKKSLSNGKGIILNYCN